MFVPSVESACDRHLQCVCETAFRQFNLKGILPLRLGIAHSRFRRLSKVRLVRRLTDERGFGFLRTPRFDADAAESDSGVSNDPTSHANHDCRGGEGELVRSAVAQFEIELLAGLDWRRQREMRDEVARFENRFAMR